MKPILFSTEMVQAILAGRKTQTRRVVKAPVLSNAKTPDSISIDGNKFVFRWNGPKTIGGFDIKPPYNVGDVLWVRETWAKNTDYANPALYIPHGFIHKATGEYHMGIKWRSPVTMPREAARLFLRVKDVRVERVQDITDDDSLAEGIPDDLDFPMDKVYCPRCNGEGLIGSLNARSLGYQEVDCPQCQTAKQRFANLWNARNAKRGYGWDSNPWVWVIEFEKCNPE